MTVAAGDTKIREQGNGSKTAFDFPFKIFSDSDIVAQKINASGVVTTGVLNTDYTVSFVPGVAGGTVTWSVAPSASEDSFLYLALAETQPTPIPNVGSLQKIVIENALDRAVLLIKQLSEQITRSFKFAISSEVDPETAGIIPDPEADKVLGWNALGTALENKALVITSTSYPGVLGAGADASKPASPGVNDVYFATDTNKWYRCITAGTWTTVNNSGIATDMVAAATTNIGAGTGDFVNITGNTGITSFGTIAAGIRIWTRFAGTPQITHNATSMILPGGANITAAAGDVACWESLGSGNWRCLVYTRASGRAVIEPAVVVPAFENRLLHVRDEKAANTGAGANSADTWQTRTLNTVTTNEISGASLGSNQITLPAGTYFIEAFAPAYGTATHKCKLRNITDGSDVIIGNSQNGEVSSGSTDVSMLRGRFTIASQKVFELQHWSGDANAFGSPTNAGVIEVYAEVLIWKVA